APSASRPSRVRDWSAPALRSCDPRSMLGGGPDPGPAPGLVKGLDLGAKVIEVAQLRSDAPDHLRIPTPQLDASVERRLEQRLHPACVALLTPPYRAHVRKLVGGVDRRSVGPGGLDLVAERLLPPRVVVDPLVLGHRLDERGDLVPEPLPHLADRHGRV